MKRWMPLILVLLGWFAVIANGMGLFRSANVVPGWDIASICKGASDPANCATLETAAHKTVSSTWDILPDTYRTVCLGEVVKADDQSFRALAQCLEQQTQKGLDKNVANTAATVATPGGAVKNMGTTELMAALLSERESWGTGPDPAKVEAPLAAGAVVPLPKSSARAEVAGQTPDTIINAAEITPPAELTPVPQDQIQTAMTALLTERAGWGDAPTPPTLTIPEAMTALLAERATWGTGPEVVVVAAPLAAGAVVPLPKSGANVSVAGPTPTTIINEPTLTPPAELTPVPQDQIQIAMAALLAERAGWGTEPSVIPDKPVDPLAALLAERKSWGTSVATEVGAPLAAGAVVPLPQSAARVEIAGATPDTIVHDAVITPAAVLTPVPQDQIQSAMAALLAERAGWGTAPSEVSAALTPVPQDQIQSAMAALLAERAGWGTAPSTVSDKPADPLAALLAERESWGTSVATEVGAPLAAGAVVPLPQSAARVEIAGATPDTIVHDAVITPAAVLTPVPQDQIQSAMAALLAERAGWGTAPSAVSDKPSDPLAALLAERESWGTSVATEVGAPLAAGAVVPLPQSAARVAVAGPTSDTIVHDVVIIPVAVLTPVPQDQIQSAMAALLAERAGWGSEPGQQVAAVAPATVAKLCQDDLTSIARSGMIRFGSSSAALDAASNATLDKIAAKAKACAGVVILVEGHTDSTGSAKLNNKLSQARAEAVVSYLKAAGLAGDQLRAMGFGSSKPIASNKTKASRRKNRRIDFTVTAK